MKITPQLFEAFLHCPTKCWLKAAGEHGTGNAYAEWVEAENEKYRAARLECLRSTVPEDEVVFSPPADSLKRGEWRWSLNLLVQKEELESTIDALERVPAEGRGKGAQFIPVRFVPRNKLTMEDKLLLGFDAAVLSDVLARGVGLSKIIHGDDHAILKIKTSSLADQVRKMLQNTVALLSNKSPPDLILKRHCSECEFRDQCRQKAIEKDDLSLLAGMTAKERNRHHSKGIFTVTQLSYTFRPRRTPKRAKHPGKPHHFSLQALAIRENTVFIHGKPELPDSNTQVYLDIEGLPDRDSYYLIGVLISSASNEHFHSFWTDNSADEVSIFSQFVQTVCDLPDSHFFHFGDYDSVALKRIKARMPEPLQAHVDFILAHSTNVLSLVYPNLYFPTTSNSLKDLATFLKVSPPGDPVGGLQSIIWRRAWEETQDTGIKAKLIAYNKTDCLNLKHLCHFVRHIDGTLDVNVANTDTMRTESRRRCLFSSKACVIDDLQYVTKCAYFDYQRDHIFFRTHPHLKPANKGNAHTHPKRLRPNTVIHQDVERCPRCRSKDIESSREMSYTVVDLRFSKGHVRKWITENTYWDYHCRRCHRPFNPIGAIEHTEMYGAGLMNWCVYCNVLRGQNMLQVNKTLQDAFNVALQDCVLYRFKGYVANTFEGLYEDILKAVLKSPVLHIDETVVNLRKALTAYVWVVTSMDMVYYFYRPSREGAFLHEMLKGFSGVLISDFFAAYDSLPCEQQKCLLHFVRDINEDLLRNPFDTELKCLAQDFGSLLRPIIKSVDRYGLKQYHLQQHKRAVTRFLNDCEAKELTSEVANKYKKRFYKSGARMFTFLEYDGIPWNNTNAEHAIKLFAKYRRNADGRFTEQSVKEYLVLASVFETCEFNNINVLQFLLSGEKTLQGLLGMVKRKR